MSDLADEVSRIEESAAYSSQGQFEAAKSWRLWNWVLGGFTASASGVGGVLTFANGHVQTAGSCLAIAGALSAAVLTTLRPGEQAEGARRVANDYLAIQGEARRLRLLDIQNGESVSVRQQLERLAEKQHEVNVKAAPLSARAYKAAKRNIESGGQTYGVDR